MRWPAPATSRCGASLRALGALVSFLGAASPAAAQSTLSGGRGTLLVPDADTVPPTQFTTSFGAGWTNGLRSGFHPAPAGVTFGFLNDLDVGLGLRSWSQGDPEAHGASVDPQLALKLRLVREAPGRPGLALALAIDHPFQGLDVSPSVIVHESRGSFLLTGELGWREPLRGGPGNAAAPFAGLGAGWWPSASTSVFAQALAEGGAERRVWLMPGFAWSLLGPDPLADRREAQRAKAKAAIAALEADVGAPVDAVLPKADLGADAVSARALGARVTRLSAPGRVTVFVTGGPALGAEPGWRILAGIQISSFDEFLQDSDGDGIPDRVDRCPFEPEDWDGYQDDDGCPDHGTEVLRKLTLDRLAAAAAQGPKLTTPVPRFRLRIREGEVPDGERRAPDTAPMYRPLDAPPPAAPPPAAPPPAAPTPTVPPPGAPRPHASSRSAAPPSGPRPAGGPATPPSPRKHAARSEDSKSAGAASASDPRRRADPSRPPASAVAAPVTVAVLVLPPVSVIKKPGPLVAVPVSGSWGRSSASASLRVEREVSATAYVHFTSPDQPLTERDRESVERAARAAAEEGGALLVWARARDTSLLPEAARRADAIVAVAAREGELPTTRVTTSAETWGAVDVQVSAAADRFRITSAAAPEREPPRDGAGAPPLESGEAGNRQLREVALAHRGDLERCLAPALDGGDGESEAWVRIEVEPDGRATATLRPDSPLWRPSAAACVAGEARGWRLPVTDEGYVFELPVSVSRGSGAP